MFLNPFIGFLDAWIIFRNAAIDHALDAGIGHAAIAEQTGFRTRSFHLAAAATRRRINKAAVIDLVRPGLIVVFALEILAATDKDQRFLQSRIIGRNARILECVKEHLGVG